MFYGREKELAELNRRWKNNRFEFGVVYGSRRIGKSALLDFFIRDKNGFRYQARQGTEEENLRAFSREFGRFMGLQAEMKFESFEAALDAVASYASRGKFVFIIDEVSYFCVRSKGFLSTLQYYIDGPFKETDLLVLLSGSNISFMKDMLNNRNDPLYKRATFEMNLKKLPFSEAEMFLKGKTVGEKTQSLSLFGTFPYYLAMLEQGKSFEDNLKSLLFNPFGTLLDAPDKVLPSGTAEQNTYNTILRAISMSKRSNREIADYAGVTPNYISPYLASLTEMQIVERREAFTRNKKLNYYEISDNLLRFWYRFIYGNADRISLGLGNVIYDSLQDQIRNFLNHGFEDLIIDYLTEQNLQGKLPHFYGAIQNYKVENSRLGRSIELDGLAESIEDGGKSLLVVECKYRKNPASMAVLQHVEENVSIFPKYEQVDYYLFSKSGFTEELLTCSRKDVHLISVGDIFSE